MLLTRKNLRGGRTLSGFPLCEENGLLGYKIGYCAHCNESILIRTLDCQEILAYLFRSQKQYKKLIDQLTPKFSLWQGIIRWIAKWVNGKLQETPVYN